MVQNRVSASAGVPTIVVGGAATPAAEEAPGLSIEAPDVSLAGDRASRRDGDTNAASAGMRHADTS